jgi:uroporphyrinogen decarboxylase
MLSRRTFLAASAAAAVLRGATLSSKQRVDRALRGEDLDRSPFSLWHHFLDEAKPPEDHARSTLAFHDKFHTDLVKVMSDYPYPKPKGAWYQLKAETNPFPKQIRALGLIRDGLGGKAYFVETIFNPWNVAEKLSSKEAVLALMHEQPQKLLDALDVIARAEASHAKRSVDEGAAGVFLAIANAQTDILTQDEYARFSEPFDKMVLQGALGAPLNVLHLHGDKVYLDRFYEKWPVAGINYSMHGTGVPIAAVRKKYSDVILGGVDETKYRQLTALDLKRQWIEARSAAGAKFILTPGCSVPNDSTDEELGRLGRLFGA